MSAWTTERPTKAGWWWFKLKHDPIDEAVVFQVFEEDGKLTCDYKYGGLNKVPDGEWQPVQGPRE